MLHWKEYIYIRISIYEYILNHMGFIQHHTTAKTLFVFLFIHQPPQTPPPQKKTHGSPENGHHFFTRWALIFQLLNGVYFTVTPL